MNRTMQFEPGIDRHVWESRWASLEEELDTDPADALPDLADLVREMLIEAGYDLTDPVVREGEEREVVAEFVAADEVAGRVRSGEEVEPDEVVEAIEAFRELHDFVVDAVGDA